MTPRLLAVATIAGLALAGCGLKGPLTMPPKPGDVIIRPAPADAKPAPEAPPPSPPGTGSTTRG